MTQPNRTALKTDKFPRIKTSFRRYAGETLRSLVGRTIPKKEKAEYSSRHLFD